MFICTLLWSCAMHSVKLLVFPVKHLLSTKQGLRFENLCVMVYLLQSPLRLCVKDSIWIYKDKISQKAKPAKLRHKSELIHINGGIWQCFCLNTLEAAGLRLDSIAV